VAASHPTLVADATAEAKLCGERSARNGDFFLDTVIPPLYTFRNCNNCVAAQGRIETMATKKAAKKPAKKAAKKAAKKK
jgi:hypothetical protein